MKLKFTPFCSQCDMLCIVHLSQVKINYRVGMLFSGTYVMVNMHNVCVKLYYCIV